MLDVQMKIRRGKEVGNENPRTSTSGLITRSRLSSTRTLGLCQLAISI